MKVRVSYSKLGKIRFTGHRDVARIWERTLRKAEVPVAMSTGFTPRLKMAFGLALPTGAESLVELLDVTLAEDVADLDLLVRRLDESLPVGMAVTGIRECGSSEVSLQEDVVATTWVMAIDAPDVPGNIDRLVMAREVWVERERKGESRRDDIRSGILGLRTISSETSELLPPLWLGESSGVLIEATLTTAGRGIRPTELVEALVPGCEPWNHLTRVLRINQLIERDGEHVDVLSARPAHTEVCA
jgi:radical SAM-linked protein